MKMVNYQELFIDCLILIHNHEFLTSLYKFELIEFDIIRYGLVVQALGIDKLS